MQFPSWLPTLLIFGGGFATLIGGVLGAIEQSRTDAKITHLGEQTHAVLTGGDSFPSIMPILNLYPNIFQFSVKNHGDHDINDLVIEIHSDAKKNLPIGSPARIHLAGHPFVITREARIKSGTANLGGIVPLESDKAYGYAINFEARNGHFHQRLRIRQFNGAWEHATFVRRAPIAGDDIHRVLFLDNSNGFDLSALDEAWPSEVGQEFLE